jgi:hypothetical protein
MTAELANSVKARERRVLAEDHSQCFASEAEANAAAAGCGMTRAELEQVRSALDGAGRVLHDNIDYRGGAYMECRAPEALSEAIAAIAIIDAELAKPEAREWRVLAEDHSQFFGSEAEANAVADWLVSNGNVGSAYVDSRTVGPWERAEVTKIEGETE